MSLENTNQLGEVYTDHMLEDHTEAWYDVDTVTWYQQLGLNLLLYVTPVILVAGCVGNLGCCVVLQSRHFRASRTALLLTWLAGVDALVLLTNLLDLWLGALVYGAQASFLRNQGVWGCRLGVFLTYLLSHLAAWTLVLVSVDRLLTVTLPPTSSARRRLLTPRVHALALAALTVALAAFDSHVLVTIAPIIRGPESRLNSTTVGDSYVPHSCSIMEAHATGHYPAFLLWSDFALLSFVPFVLILVCNVVILMFLRRGNSQRVGACAGRSKKVSSVTVMLVAVSTVFLITTTPLVVYYILYEYIYEWTADKPETYALITSVFGDSLLVLLCYTNNAVNFALYFLCGSKFRNAIKLMVCKYIGKKSSSSSGSDGRSQHQVTEV